ncbi:unnamed protein product, partial [Tetraodon nigroviridis]
MSDVLLLLLVVVLLVCLIATVGFFLLHSGLLTEVHIKTGAPPIRNVTIAYKFKEGPYKECGAAFTESSSIGPKLSSIGVFYDDPKQKSSTVSTVFANLPQPDQASGPSAPRPPDSARFCLCSSPPVALRQLRQRPPEKCRYAVGSVLCEGEEKPDEELQKMYEKFGFKVFSLPEVSHAVTTTFPCTTSLSYVLGPYRVYPRLGSYIEVRS